MKSLDATIGNHETRRRPPPHTHTQKEKMLQDQRCARLNSQMLPNSPPPQTASECGNGVHVCILLGFIILCPVVQFTKHKEFTRHSRCRNQYPQFTREEFICPLNTGLQNRSPNSLMGPPTPQPHFIALIMPLLNCHCYHFFSKQPEQKVSSELRYLPTQEGFESYFEE